ncbi:MAG: glycosyltransferase family 2 protein [Candidatus Paceibacterota bacterium]
MENKNQPKLSIILPCHNEEQSIQKCISDIQNELNGKLNFEIVVVNNNSDDFSGEILKKMKETNPNLKVFFEKKIGYGSACNRGFKEALGKYLLLMDIDQTYPVEKIMDFVSELDKSSEFVIGNRFTGEIKKGAMPALHQFIGNPLLSFILRLFFKTKVRDSHCGMRAIRKKCYEKLNLRTTGMEFASEMVIKVLREKLRISEIAISYHPRIGESKLKSFRDGWRHLRFMLLYSPNYLFFVPGIICFSVGIISMIVLYFTNLKVVGLTLIDHPIFVFSLLVIIGYQLIIFAGFAKAYAINHLEEKNELLDKIFKYISIEKASTIGLLGIIFGLIIYFLILRKWINSDFGALNEIKSAVIGFTFIVIGVQTISSAFMLSILSIKER